MVENEQQIATLEKVLDCVHDIALHIEIKGLCL